MLIGEWVIEVNQAGCGGQGECGGVLVEDAGGAGGLAGGLPDFEVGDGGLGEGWIEFYADGFFEGELGGCSMTARPLPQPMSSEGVVAGGVVGGGVALPTVEHGAEAGWGDGEVGGGEDVVGVIGGEVDSADEAAGVDAVLGVEGMGDGGETGPFGLGEPSSGKAQGLFEAAMDERPAEFAKS